MKVLIYTIITIIDQYELGSVRIGKISKDIDPEKELTQVDQYSKIFNIIFNVSQHLNNQDF